LALPFGTRFCLARKLFERLDGFREDVSYGGSSFVCKHEPKKFPCCTEGLIRTRVPVNTESMVGRQQHNHLTHSKASISRVVEIPKSSPWFCCKTWFEKKLSAVSFNFSHPRFYSISNAFAIRSLISSISDLFVLTAI